MLKMRSRIALSKPFITDKTVISTITPRAIPIIEVKEIKEMK
jgi:hypothetical protein